MHRGSALHAKYASSSGTPASRSGRRRDLDGVFETFDFVKVVAGRSIDFDDQRRAVAAGASGRVHHARWDVADIVLMEKMAFALDDDRTGP